MDDAPPLNMTLQWVSPHALLVTLGAPDSVPASLAAGALIDRLFQCRPQWLVDAYGGFGKVMVMSRDPDSAAVDAWVRSVDLAAGDPSEATPTIDIPTCYDPAVAPDIESVAERLGVGASDVAAWHSAQPVTVLAMGFAPGFGYLGPIDARLRLPRLATPKARVPAGSVAIAEAQTVIYPVETPGGWHLIGRTAVQLMRYTPEPEPRFRVGQRVRFVPITLRQWRAA